MSTEACSTLHCFGTANPFDACCAESSSKDSGMGLGLDVRTVDSIGFGNWCPITSLN